MNEHTIKNNNKNNLVSTPRSNGRRLVFVD